MYNQAALNLEAGRTASQMEFKLSAHLTTALTFDGKVDPAGSVCRLPLHGNATKKLPDNATFTSCFIYWYNLFYLDLFMR